MLSFSESQFSWLCRKSDVEETVVWGNQSILELMERYFGVKHSSSWDSKSAKQYNYPRSLATWFFVERILKKSRIWHSEFLSFWGQNQRMFPLLICGTVHLSTLPVHHREHSISQLSLVSFDVFCKQYLSLCIFLEMLFQSICYNVHQRIVSILLHNILIAFITTTPWELITPPTTFRTFFSTSSAISKYLK